MTGRRPTPDQQARRLAWIRRRRTVARRLAAARYRLLAVPRGGRR